MRRLILSLLLSSLAFFFYIFLQLVFAPSLSPHPAVPGEVIVNDISGMNATTVIKSAAPSSIEEIQSLVRTHSGKISIGGARHSMGGAHR